MCKRSILSQAEQSTNVIIFNPHKFKVSCRTEQVSLATRFRASDRCSQEKRKTINGEDILYAMSTLGFESYVDPLKNYLQKYRDVSEQLPYFRLFNKLFIQINKAIVTSVRSVIQINFYYNSVYVLEFRSFSLCHGLVVTHYDVFAVVEYQRPKWNAHIRGSYLP